VSHSFIDPRPIRTAVLLAVGSELTNGETRDTNSGDLARWLVEAGVEVLWISSLPDRLATVTGALRDALAAADLVITTGGLGPTPDDLTRESIAEVLGERPALDPDLERWLRNLFERRGMAFAEINLKQAWMIPSGTAIANERGTAPGWWIDAADGRVLVALPGPPREMSGMWREGVMPRLRKRGLGRETVVRTYRLAGIGESTVAARLGERLLRAANPVVATYARSDAVDVRITAVSADGHTAIELVDEAESEVLAAIGDHVWGRDGDTWPEVLGRLLAARGWTAALVEIGTGGAASGLLGESPWLLEARLLTGPAASTGGTATAEARSVAALPLPELAARVRYEAGASIGMAVRVTESAGDTHVDLAVVGPWGVSEGEQVAFLGGSEGRRRAALALAGFVRALIGKV
jgi:nicotinamide-nucleotide amidase